MIDLRPTIEACKAELEKLNHTIFALEIYQAHVHRRHNTSESEPERMPETADCISR